MNEVIAVFKGMLDPLFIVFVLLFVSFIILFKNFKKKSDSLNLFFCIIFIYAASIAPVANYLCYYLEKDYFQDTNAGTPKNIDAIVVLGNGTKEIKSLKHTFSSDFGSLRVLHAVTTYNQSGAQYFVCSGKGDKEYGNASEAQTMAGLAGELGVPKDKIKIEENSKNTTENASFVSKMLGNKKIRIGLVTSAFHMQRSEREFKKYFDNVIPLPAHYLYSSPGRNVVLRYMPQTDELYKTAFAVKEIIARLWYRIK